MPLTNPPIIPVIKNKFRVEPEVSGAKSSVSLGESIAPPCLSNQ